VGGLHTTIIIKVVDGETKNSKIVVVVATGINIIILRLPKPDVADGMECFIMVKHDF
jgi:hypothetical protein